MTYSVICTDRDGDYLRHQSYTETEAIKLAKQDFAELASKAQCFFSISIIIDNHLEPIWCRENNSDRKLE